MNTGKYMILLIKKTHLTKKSCGIMSQITNMIKQKEIIGQVLSFHFGKSPLRLASL
jgi:hypothetical protein